MDFLAHVWQRFVTLYLPWVFVAFAAGAVYGLVRGLWGGHRRVRRREGEFMQSQRRERDLGWARDITEPAQSPPEAAAPIRLLKGPET